MSVIGILIALLLLIIVLYAVNIVIGMLNIPDPMKKIIWLIVAVDVLIVLAQMFGVYNFGNLNFGARQH